MSPSTVVAARPRTSSGGGRPVPRPMLVLGTAAVVAVLGALVAVAVAADPRTVLLGCLVLAVVVAMTLRVEWAVLGYVIAEPFGDQLQTLSSVSVKAIGLLLFAAWLLRLVTRLRPLALRHPSITAAGVLALVVLAASVAHPLGGAGAVVVVRWASYLAITVVLVDTMRTTLSPRRVAAAYVWSSSAAAVVGLVSYLGERYGRAAGPMSDPNDFAFFLVAALPLALALWRTDASARFRHRYLVCALLLLLATLATYSRGAVLGLLLVVVVALLTGQLRWRTALVGAVGAAVAVGIVVLAVPTVVSTSLEAKQHVSGQNVDDRLISWSLAGEMTADHPLLGVGPGGFRAHFQEYLDGRTANLAHLDVAHETYLEVSAELGLVGLAAFLVVLGSGLASAVRAVRAGRDRELAVGVCLAFVSTLVAASFLSEAFYLPLWLLVALGAALDPGRARRTPGTTPAVV